MKKIFENINTYLKILTRSKWTWIAFAANIVYFILVCNSNRRHNAGQMLHSSSYSATAIMLFFIVFGFYIARLEEEVWFQEVVASFPEGKMYKFFAKILVIVLLSFILTIIGLIIYYIFFSIINAEAYFYKNSIAYLILYWIFPFIIAGFLGLVIGNIIKSKWAYILIIILWSILSCVNEVIFQTITNLANVDFNLLGSFLNLVQTDTWISYNSLYGLPLEKMRWIRILLWFIILVYSLTILYIKEVKVHKRKAYIIASLSFLVVFLISIKSFINCPLPVLNNNSNYSVSIYYKNYYKKHKEVNFKNEDNFKIKGYDIKLKAKDELKSDVLMDIELTKEPYDEIVFTLYHNFKVKNIRVDDKSVDFSQKGDQVKVNVPKVSSKDIKVNVVYEGKNSQAFYVNNQGMFLPYFFPWIPFKGSYNFINLESDVCKISMNYPKERIYYNLEFKTNENIFTNIPKVGEDKWEGFSEEGINLVSGNLKMKKLNSGINFYYSDDTLKSEHAEAMVEEFIKGTKHLEKVCNIKDSYDVKNVLYIPHYLNYITGENMMISKDTVFINDENKYINFWERNLENKEVVLIKDIAQALLKNDNFLKQNYDMRSELFYGLEYWQYKKNNMNTMWTIIDGKKRFLERGSKTLNSSPEEELKFINNLITFIDKNKDDEEKMSKFFNNYYEKLSSEKKLGFEDLGDLFKE